MKSSQSLCGAQRAPALAFGGIVAALSAPALAQQETQQEVPQAVKLDKVEITGSSIRRIEGESGLPVQVITRQELQHGGVQTMQELLERVSANQSYGASNAAMGEGNMVVGFTGASLRGLGSERTLVLLNGRRLAPYALSGGQSVDLSAIPASAIERVEILKDGASAIYGTDAIGGVINFILRKDYRGVELNADYYATEQGGGNNGRVSLTAGIGDLAADRYNAFVSASYFKQESLAAAQRESTRTAYLPDLGVNLGSQRTIPANISQTNFITGENHGFKGLRNPTIPFPGGPTADSCAPPYSFAIPGNPTCWFDFASVIDTIPEYETANVIGRLTWNIDADTQFFAEGSYYWGRFTQRISPTPIDSLWTDPPMTLPAGSPYYPAAYVAGLEGGRPDQPLYLQYRTVELGPRVDEADVDQWNGVVGVQGTLAGWSYELAANITANRQVDNYGSGNVYGSKFGPLSRSGVVNPFGPNTSDVLGQMRATQATGQANDSRASNYGAALTVSNDVYALPAGPLAVAFGIEARRESLEQSNSDFIIAGDVLGGVGAVPSLAPTRRNVFALFGEVSVPIARQLEANLAVRYDNYSDFGATTNPKLTLRWQPAKSVLLRAAYGTGFRAPTLSDVHLPQSIEQTFELTDPARCPDPENPGPGDDCLPISVKLGGNPALRPETSQQVNAGIVFEPVTGFSTSIDYYWVRLENAINVVPVDVILGPDHAAWEADYIVREAPDPAHPGLPGRIAYIVQYTTNVGTLTTSGIDANLQWRAPATPIGRFAFGINGTYVIDYSQSDFVSTFVPTSVGTRGALGAIARYRQYAQIDWSYGPWGATLANNYQSGYSEPCLEGDISGCTTRKVGSYSVWDLQLRYAPSKNATLTLGIRNALDAAPPLTNQGDSFQVGIDPSYADPRGRMFYAALRYAFD